VVTKLPKKALDHLKRLNKIWTNIQQPSFFRCRSAPLMPSSNSTKQTQPPSEVP
jgi:hypothetical protein